MSAGAASRTASRSPSPAPPPPPYPLPPPPLPPPATEAGAEPTAREEALRHEVVRLRREASGHARAAARNARVIDALRSAADEGREGDEHEVAAARDAARGERKRARALERVIQGLRGRLAEAEGRAAKGLLFDSEVLRREWMETEVGRLRGEVERLEGIVFEGRREMGGPEGEDERVRVLEQEVRGRTDLLKEMKREGERLRGFLVRYEEELRGKEAEVGRLRREVRRLGESRASKASADDTGDWSGEGTMEVEETETFDERGDASDSGEVEVTRSFDESRSGDSGSVATFGNFDADEDTYTGARTANYP